MVLRRLHNNLYVDPKHVIALNEIDTNYINSEQTMVYLSSKECFYIPLSVGVVAARLGITLENH